MPTNITRYRFPLCCGITIFCNFITSGGADNRKNELDDIDRMIKEESNLYGGLNLIALNGEQKRLYNKELLKRGWHLVIEDVPNAVHQYLSKVSLYARISDKAQAKMEEAAAKKAKPTVN